MACAIEFVDAITSLSHVTQAMQEGDNWYNFVHALQSLPDVNNFIPFCIGCEFCNFCASVNLKSTTITTPRCLSNPSLLASVDNAHLQEDPGDDFSLLFEEKKWPL